MINTTVIELKTYSEGSFDISTMTIPEYVGDPRFRIHGVAVRWADGRTEFRTDVEELMRQLRGLYGADLAGTNLVCHHAHFGLYVLARKFDLHPRHFIDTRLLALQVHGCGEAAGDDSVSLTSLAERYLFDREGDMEFLSAVRQPNGMQIGNLRSNAIRDAEFIHVLFAALLPQVENRKTELAIQMHTVRLFTERGVNVDVDGIADLEVEIAARSRSAKNVRGLPPDALANTARFIAELEKQLRRTGRSLPVKAGKRGTIPAISNKDPEMQALLIDSDPKVKQLAELWIAQKSDYQAAGVLKTLRSLTTVTGGVLPVHLDYCGAHTGRFSGGGGFNIQNLGRNGVGGQIRGLLRPRPGHVFLVGDFSQVEARITARYAGEEDLVQAYQDGRDVYSEFASEVFGRVVRKPTGDDDAETRQMLSALRQVGKAAVLGLGFGMGALKFLNQLRGQQEISRLFQTGQLTPRRCKEIVDAFRTNYANIPAFWDSLDSAARAAIDGRETELNGLRFTHSGGDVRIVLPSGRSLKYRDLRLEESNRAIACLNSDGKLDQFTPGGPSLVYENMCWIYGGKFAENIAQATARDLLVDLILRLEDQGIRVIFHVHDEVISEVAETDAASLESVMLAQMRQVPPWAAGWPIDAEVRIAERYGK
jgi:DNA polymerase I-like protein with 3'-5' exonuclease and polymerase domains